MFTKEKGVTFLREFAMYIEIVRLIWMGRFSIVFMFWMCFYFLRQKKKNGRFWLLCSFPRTVFSPDGDVPVYNKYKVHLQLCLRTDRGHSSHSSEVCMQGRWAPMFRLAELSLSLSLSLTYLPVKSFIPLITGQWLYQQTASGVFSTPLFTQIIWIIVLVDFGASFLME